MGDEFLCLVICLLNWNASFPRFLQASTGRRIKADVAIMFGTFLYTCNVC